MIDNKDGTYIYLYVPSIYEYIYNKLLIKMAQLGIDIINDCASTCKGEHKQLINAWYMFQSACAAYAIGEDKKADFIINYINLQMKFGYKVSSTIFIGYYNNDIKTFINSNIDDIIDNSIITTKTIEGFDETKIIINSTSNIHYLLIPKQTNLVSAYIEDGFNTTLWNGDPDDSAYSTRDIIYNDIYYTMYYYYSPINNNNNIHITIKNGKNSFNKNINNNIIIK